MRLSTLALVLSVVLAACGEPVAPPSGGGGDSDTADTRYTATATVLDDGDGPELCLGAIMDSLPPQCGGPKIVGWDWDALEGYESASGTRWGSFTVVGTYDGERFTLTEPPRAPQPSDQPDFDAARFATPCEEPPGGWRPVDPDRATEEAQQTAIAYARAQPEFAGLWVDQSINPAAQEPDMAEKERARAKLVLNARFTGELARHEAAMREHWGGALCVSEARHSMAELEAIRAEVDEELEEVLISDVDEVTGVVSFHVVAAPPGLQGDLDERYGEGVVRLTSALRPVGERRQEP